MSAGVCGKRVGCFEEIFGGSTSSVNKRSRFTGFVSPVRVPESEDSVACLIRMFPNLNPEFVESILRAHNNNIEDAIESLHALSLGDVTAHNVSQTINTADLMTENGAAVSGGQVEEQTVENISTPPNVESAFDFGNTMDGPQWVDFFVQEMTNATDLHDARARASKILEAFEKSVIARSRASSEHEQASLKEHLQILLRDNQILKRAVAIQHERNSEQEVKTKEVQQLKHIIGQYQEQLKTLELTNYTLKLHLQRAQDNSSIPGKFHPDIC